MKTQIKRILSAALILALSLSLFPAPALVASATSVIDVSLDGIIGDVGYGWKCVAYKDIDYLDRLDTTDLDAYLVSNGATVNVIGSNKRKIALVVENNAKNVNIIFDDLNIQNDSNQNWGNGTFLMYMGAYTEVKLFLNGKNYIGTADGSTFAIPILNSMGSTLTIGGAGSLDIASELSPVITNGYNSTIIINGGTLNVSRGGVSGPGIQNDSKLIINGGSVNATGNGAAIASTGELIINGGSIKAPRVAEPIEVTAGTIKNNDGDELFFREISSSELTAQYPYYNITGVAAEDNGKYWLYLPKADETTATETVTVQFTDWNDTPLKTQLVTKGDDATAPADPSRTGYTFTGWDTDFTNVTQNLTVKAQYTINSYTVTFLDWDGSKITEKTAQYGGTVEPPANPPREGYTFTGWDKALTDIRGNLSVTALYTQNQTSVIDLAIANPAATGVGWTYSDNVYTILNGADVTLINSNAGSQRRVAVAANAKADVTLNGATIQGLTSVVEALKLNPGAEVALTIQGNNLLTGGGAYILPAVPSVGTMGSAAIDVRNAKLTINGTGKLTANAYDSTSLNSNASGIGGGTTGEITINGGTLSATGSLGNAGISGGTVTVSGGTVTATGGIAGGGRYSAGISGTVTISGGTVTAIGGSGDTITASGPGGAVGLSGTVKITGGTVTASGTGGGAGISGTVKITGGTIIASGTGGGAGIGGSTGEAGGDVVIDGGSVRATGGGGSAEAIGHGDKATDSGTLYNSLNNHVTLQTITVGAANSALAPGTYGGVVCLAAPDAQNGIYGINDVKSDASGKVYFYLPVASPDSPVIDLSVAKPAVSSPYWTYSATEELYTLKTGVNVTVINSNIGSRRRIAVEENAVVAITLQNMTIAKMSGAYAGLQLGAKSKVALTASGTNAVAGGIRTSGAELTIDGMGSLTVTAESILDPYESTNAAAGIGGGVGQDGGTVIINGGTVTATGAIGGAGIGTGVGSSGNINDINLTINGGIVTATGGTNGAGIGGGTNMANAGNITINGGIVTANGGAVTQMGGSGNFGKNGGPGIGSGAGGGGNTRGVITINGGTVTANGEVGSAGIGGGFNHGGGTVYINGGTITARGGGGGAGIGSGDISSYVERPETRNGGTLRVTGGTVTAIGGDYAAGIGGGNNCTDGIVVIDGGSVKASGATVAIGAGHGQSEVRAQTNSLGANVSLKIISLGSANAAAYPGTIGGVVCATSPDAASGIYGIKDVKADTGGIVYFYLPESKASSGPSGGGGGGGGGSGGGGGGGGEGGGTTTPPPTTPKPTDPPANGGNTTTTPADKPPVKNPDGTTTLPGGGTITVPGGTEIEAPAGTVIGKDGTVTIPNGKEANVVLPIGSEATIPGGSTIDSKGGITVGDGGKATVTAPGGRSEIAVPGGSTIGKDGQINIGSGGGSVTHNSGHSFAIDEDTVIILDEDAPLGYFAVADNSFTEVQKSDWFYDSVMFVYTHGLFSGTSETTFSPNTSMTRDMIVTVLHRLAGEPGIDGGGTAFSDVVSGTWYTDAVKWAAANGIVSGIGGNLFSPEGNISRQDLAVTLMRYTDFAGLKLPAVRDYTGFADDADVANYAKEAIEAFFKAGIINGKGNNLADPKGAATRAEVATMLNRFIEAIEKK
jgi:uncharacterized repeat protein (TIGR02543 family)